MRSLEEGQKLNKVEKISELEHRPLEVRETPIQRYPKDPGVINEVPGEARQPVTPPIA